jgi:hypothetical protein
MNFEILRLLHPSDGSLLKSRQKQSLEELQIAQKRLKPGWLPESIPCVFLLNFLYKNTFDI